MTLKEANTILDMARDGAAIPSEVITWALTVTGDALQRNWSAHHQVGEFCDALRKVGLL